MMALLERICLCNSIFSNHLYLPFVRSDPRLCVLGSWLLSSSVVCLYLSNSENFVSAYTTMVLRVYRGFILGWRAVELVPTRVVNHRFKLLSLGLCFYLLIKLRVGYNCTGLQLYDRRKKMSTKFESNLCARGVYNSSVKSSVRSWPGRCAWYFPYFFRLCAAED